MVFSATYFGSSGWLIEFDKLNVLVDPWLEGSLKFAPGAWFFEGNLTKFFQIPEQIDLLLLTQGLPDHCHPPTLENLNKSIPVIGSESAINIVSKIGFSKLNVLKPGECTLFKDLKIEATKGAPVPNIENGYILQHKAGSLYLEPHGFLDHKISATTLDALITPVIDVSIPIAGAFIKGKSILPSLVEKFNPLTILSSTTGGSAVFSGLLSKLIKTGGDINNIDKSIIIKTNFISSAEGCRYELRTRS